MSVDGCTTHGHRALAAVVASLCALAAAAPSARAATPTVVSLEYEIAAGIDGCPDAEQFRASVAHQLGYDPFRATADKRVAVQIARKELGFDGRIRWSDAEGHWTGDRRLSSRHAECTEIAASVAFSVAVQIQLVAALAPAAPPEPIAEPAQPAPPAASPKANTPKANTTPPQPPRPAETDPVELTAPVEPASAPSGLRLSIGAGPALALGVAPRAAGLARLFASGRVGFFSLELAGDAALPVTEQDGGGRGFTLDRFAAQAAACGHVAALAACVTSTVGRLQAHGLGVDLRDAPAGWFTQLGARLGAAYDFGERYFAAARVDGLVMTAPVKVRLNDSVVWTTPRIGAVFGIDFGARFF